MSDALCEKRLVVTASSRGAIRGFLKMVALSPTLWLTTRVPQAAPDDCCGSHAGALLVADLEAMAKPTEIGNETYLRRATWA